MPASSPSTMFIVSTLKPFLSAHLQYILYSIEHQSQDSVPPAPAFREIIALLASYSPVRSVERRSASSLFSKSFRSALISGTTEASSSSLPISIRSMISLYCAERPSASATVFCASLSSFILAFALSVSFQKSGASISRESSSILCLLYGRFKESLPSRSASESPDNSIFI